MNVLEPIPGETDEQRDIRMNKDVAAFSYLWIMSVFIYLTKKESKFVRYHSRQGIVLFLLSIPISMIPYLGKFLMFFIVAGMLLGFVHAAQGQYADVPFAGDLAKGDLKAGDLLHSILRSLRKALDTLEGFVKKGERKPESPRESMDTAPKPPVP